MIKRKYTSSAQDTVHTILALEYNIIKPTQKQKH